MYEEHGLFNTSTQYTYATHVANVQKAHPQDLNNVVNK